MTLLVLELNVYAHLGATSNTDEGEKPLPLRVKVAEENVILMILQPRARLPFQSHPNPLCSVSPLPTLNTSLSAKNIGEASHPGPERARSLLRITMSPSTVSFQNSTNNLLLETTFCGPLFTFWIKVSVYSCMFSFRTLAFRSSVRVYFIVTCQQVVFGWRPKALKQLCFNTR